MVDLAIIQLSLIIGVAPLMIAHAFYPDESEEAKNSWWRRNLGVSYPKGSILAAVLIILDLSCIILFYLYSLAG